MKWKLEVEASSEISPPDRQKLSETVWRQLTHWFVTGQCLHSSSALLVGSTRQSASSWTEEIKRRRHHSADVRLRGNSEHVPTSVLTDPNKEDSCRSVCAVCRWTHITSTDNHNSTDTTFLNWKERHVEHLLRWTEELVRQLFIRFIKCLLTQQLTERRHFLNGHSLNV